MRNKGFTLIELLAVIVILAIIALIATPIILGIIKDTKKEADQRSVEMYAKALENAVAQQQLDGSKPITGTFETKNGKEILLNGQKILTVDYDGPEITVKRIDIYEDGSVYLEEIKEEANDKLLTKKYGTKQRYTDGEEVYIDVTKGKSCTNYHADNSKTGYNGLTTTKTTDNQNSCLKFYAFLDDGGKNLNLLLDHNTTYSSAWTTPEVGTNEDGPTDVIRRLYEDTDGWSVTAISKDYTYNHATEEKRYTINYSGHKARLITAQEIAQITGKDKEENINWNEVSSLSGFKITNHPWLYDRMNDELEGYWTSSAYASLDLSYSFAWSVGSDGYVRTEAIMWEGTCGVRPVIEVLKSALN